MYLTHATSRTRAPRAAAFVAILLAVILGAGLVVPTHSAAVIPQIEVLAAAPAPAAVKPARTLSKSARILLAKVRTRGAALVTKVRYDDAFLALVNEARAKAGVKPLTVRKGLGKLAGYWTGELRSGTTGYALQHNPDLTAAVTAIYPRVRAWGENVAAFSVKYHSAKQVFAGYMASPGHRANILKASYRYIGVATACKPGSKVTCFNTMNFSR